MEEERIRKVFYDYKNNQNNKTNPFTSFISNVLLVSLLKYNNYEHSLSLLCQTAKPERRFVIHVHNIVLIFRSCEQLYIPENIDVLFDTKKIKRSETLLQSAIKKVEEALSLRERCLADVFKSVDAARKQIEILTDQILAKVTELKQKIQTKLDFLEMNLNWCCPNKRLLLITN